MTVFRGVNSQFFDLSENAGVAPARLTFQLDDQLADLKRRRLAAPLHRSELPLLAGLPDPPTERVGMDDRDELVERPAELRAESDQPRSFLWGQVKPRRQLAPNHLVLDCQVAHLPGQFPLGRAGDQKEQLRVDVPHGGCRRKVLSSMGLISFWHSEQRVATADPRHARSGCGRRRSLRSLESARILGPVNPAPIFQ